MRFLWDILYNFHWVEPGKAARSAQAYAGFLSPFLKSRGIRAVINLRGSNPDYRWWRYETDECARAGIAHFDVKLNSRQLPTRRMLLDLLRAIETAPTPLLFKCSGGQDRTSLAAALYLLNAKGWEASVQADAQFARWPYLHLPRREQLWLRMFPAFACEQSKGAPLQEWLTTRYSPHDLKAWLEARGHSGSFRRIYDAPR
jgi:protein-tyrosine phosphatase family protein